MNIKPLEDRVLLRPVKPEERTKGGIILPDTAQEKSQEGEVVAVGDDENIKVKPGDRVLYAKYSGTEVKLNGVDYLIINRSDLLAVIERDGQAPSS
ncbi:MAG: co-chaperone GroES [Limnochordaceae bacterium]|uniref:Co-chaperonin GroES n=1 Tax=Carboxydichorda subterranea TaxID=3109565 RepID=A0ABZ1BYJ3_9FIRM|nr:co-chaperone GroES [Limnochorda sp. L945t]MBE3599084.1 co-chaperone GroES [Limnochordaceae bacterium]WRP17670.1 co-chaperone GroES [Limnochorda sp. L945t]